MKTRVLLVNCYHKDADEKIVPYRNWLRAGGKDAGLELEISTAMDTRPLPDDGEYDAAVLSGSHKMIGGKGEIETGLLEFIRRNRRPLLGICYGHQALARAFGGRVAKDAVKHQGDEPIRLVRADGLFSGFPASFPMSESHEEIVERGRALEETFCILALSGPAPGLVEVLRHRELPLYGVQFHPERSGEPGKRLLANFLALIASSG